MSAHDTVKQSGSRGGQTRVNLRDVQDIVEAVVDSKVEKLSAELQQVRSQLVELTNPAGTQRKDKTETSKTRRLEEPLGEKATKKYKSLERVITQLIEENQRLTDEVQRNQGKSQIALVQDGVTQTSGTNQKRTVSTEPNDQYMDTQKAEEEARIEALKKELCIVRGEVVHWRKMYHEIYGKMQARFMKHPTTVDHEEFYSELIVESGKRVEALEAEVKKYQEALASGDVPPAKTDEKKEDLVIPQHFLDEMEALRAQSAGYEEDFNQERSAREDALKEVDNLRKRVQELELRPAEQFYHQPHHRYEPSWKCHRCSTRNDAGHVECVNCHYRKH